MDIAPKPVNPFKDARELDCRSCIEPLLALALEAGGPDDPICGPDCWPLL